MHETRRTPHGIANFGVVLMLHTMTMVVVDTTDIGEGMKNP